MKGAEDFFFTKAMGALILNDAGIAADGIAVDGVIDGEIAHIGVVHGSDQLLKGLDVLRGVGVHLDVSDMPRVAKGVIWSLDANFVERLDGEVDGHVA